MKRCLRPEITVEVNMECYQVPVAAASSIRKVRPGFPEDRSIDEQALADYMCFIQDSVEELEDLGLEIIESNTSEVSKTSRYFTLVDIEQDIEHTMKYMIFLRLSDHLLELDDEENADRVQKAVRYHRDQTKLAQEKVQGHRVIWKVREIIVNGERFDNYDDAIQFVRSRAAEWIELLRNDPYSAT